MQELEICHMADYVTSCSCFPVSHKTSEQANIIADTAVTGANEVAQSAVQGVENAAVASGLVSLVRDETAIYFKSSTSCACRVSAKKNKRGLNQISFKPTFVFLLTSLVIGR